MIHIYIRVHKHLYTAAHTCTPTPTHIYKHTQMNIHSQYKNKTKKHTQKKYSVKEKTPKM